MDEKLLEALTLAIRTELHTQLRQLWTAAGEAQELRAQVEVMRRGELALVQENTDLRARCEAYELELRKERSEGGVWRCSCCGDVNCSRRHASPLERRRMGAQMQQRSAGRILPMQIFRWHKMIQPILCAHCSAPLPIEWGAISEYAPKFCSAGCAVAAKLALKRAEKAATGGV